jgi:hypothetical protein
MKKRKDFKREETIQLANEGFSNAEIAELLGITKKRVAANKWEHNVINGTVKQMFKCKVLRRWLRPHNVVLPWSRVPNVRGRKGLVLCEQNADGTPISHKKEQLHGQKDSKGGYTFNVDDLLGDEHEQKQFDFQDDMVNHPPHYTKGGIEVIDFIESKKLGYNLGNVVKYVSRVDDKDEPLENLRKAEWYLKREIANREKAKGDYYHSDKDLPMFLRKQAE